jgi:hypothetical protein
MALEIRAAHQRPVDPGRGDLQPVLAIDRILDVEHRRERARGGLAILDQHRAVRPLRHDLHGAAGRRGDPHAHQPIAEAGQHRRCERGDARRHALLGDEPGLGEVVHVDRFHHARVPSGNKKERVPGGAHSQKPIGSSDRYEMSIRTGEI